ncbi:MAG: prepilin-type N-terminal cleavage/methylation domain-containing protein [Planctomycetes bacterium]|nr:prepilin-type N-terminal cleavage/methylation domain-containing protein [Planctomycetota bacterium]
MKISKIVMIPLNPPRRSQSGFSLVELTIVVVILGVIAMIGVPKYRTVVERAKASEALVFMHQVEAQQAGFQAWKGHYAKSFSELNGFSGSGLS